MSGDTCTKCGRPTTHTVLKTFYYERFDELLDVDVPLCKDCDGRLCKGFDVDDMSIEEIDGLIGDGKLVEQDLVEFYGNEWWRD